MKSFIILSAIIVIAASANTKIPVTRPPHTYPTISNVQPQPEEHHHQKIEMNPNGSYEYEYQSGSTSVQENGVAGERVQGRAAWVSPEGLPVEISYVADANGYHPQGSHIPQTPEYVARSLKYIRSHAPQEDVDYVALGRVYNIPEWEH